MMRARKPAETPSSVTQSVRVTPGVTTGLPRTRTWRKEKRPEIGEILDAFFVATEIDEVRPGLLLGPGLT